MAPPAKSKGIQANTKKPGKKNPTTMLWIIVGSLLALVVGVAAIIAAAHSIKVPLLVCVMGETTGAGHRRALAKAGVPVFATPADAVRGFLHLVQDRRNRAAARELPASAVLISKTSPETGEYISLADLTDSTTPACPP